MNSTVTQGSLQSSAEDHEIASARVTVGMPTYNRAHLIRRAIDSVLNQSYANVELIISDNASTDETQRICEEYALADPRVKYFRQSTNVGPSRNINDVMRRAASEFYMWLADDDWLAATYIENCVRELLEHPESSIVCGKAEYYSGDTFVLDGEIIDLLSPNPGERVLKYYELMRCNGVFYGVMRRRTIADGFARLKVLGEDWFFIAGVAFAGTVRTLTSTVIFRTLDGSSDGGNWGRFFETTGYTAGKKWPYLTISLSAARDVLMYNRSYQALPMWRRFPLAVRVFLKVYRRYGLREFWRKTMVGPIVRNRLIVPLTQSPFGRAIKSVVRR